MNEEIAAKLRAPFPASQIGKLPRVTCGACSRNKVQKHCDNHQRVKCRQCDNYITTAHMHLDYVGHAAITDRLLQADPEWVWEPMAFDQAGLPARDANGGLWIRLTVAGVTRIGYGDAQGKDGPDAVKEAIGDALRNAAMRFGVALDLWSKTPMDDHDTEPGRQPSNVAQPPAQRQQPSTNGANPDKAPAQVAAGFVTALMDVDTTERAEKGLAAVIKSPVAGVDVSGLVDADHRETLGVNAGEPVTLNELAVLVLGYVERHQRAVNAAEVSV